jgi:hypothetical protein
MRNLIELVQELHETGAQVAAGEARLEESLASGRMLPFLAEAPADEAVDGIEKAVEAAKVELDKLDRAGDTLDSEAVSKVVDEMRGKLAKVTLDPDAFGSVRAFFGMATKQITHITTGLGQANSDIYRAVTSVRSALATLKIETGGDNSDAPIKELVEGEQGRTKVTVDEFRSGIQKKLGEGGVSGWLSGVLKGVMGALRGVEPIRIDAAALAEDILSATPRMLEDYLASPAAESGKEPTTAGPEDVSAPLTAAAKELGTTPEKAAAASEKPASGRSKAYDRDEWLRIVRDGSVSDRQDFVDTVNAMAGKDILEGRVRKGALTEARWAQLAGLKGGRR